RWSSSSSSWNARRASAMSTPVLVVTRSPPVCSLIGSLRRGAGAAPVTGRSSEATRDVVLGALVGGTREDPLRRRALDEEPRAGVAGLADLGREEGGHVAHARGLLHVVGDDHDRVL